MQPFQLAGIWWLPHEDASRVAGTLDYSRQDGVRLSLFGSLADNLHERIHTKDYTTIHGAVWDSPSEYRVTLRDAFATKVTTSAGLPTRETYFANRAFIGAHLNEDEFSFSQAALRFTGLPVWAEISGRTHERIVENDRACFRLEWKAPEPIRASIPGASIVLGVGGNIRTKRYGDWSISEHPEVQIRFDTPLSDHEIHARYVFPLQNFITLGLASPNTLESCKLKPASAEHDVTELGASLADADADSGTEHTRLFGLSSLSDFSATVAAWIQFSQEHEESLAPFFNANYYRKSDLTDVRFQATVFSLMALHRRLANRQMNAWSPDEWRTALLEIMQLNEPASTELFGDLEQGANAVVAGLRFVIERNRQAPDFGRTLYHLNEKLKWLMLVYLLKQLQLPGEAHRHRNFRYAASL